MLCLFFYWISASLWKDNTRNLLAFGAGTGNTAYFGIPVALILFDEKFIGKIETTNKLLYEIPQTIGVKTGRTTEAGEVLIYEYKDDTKDLLIIVMGSEDRFTDVRALLNWLLTSYSW